MESERMRDRPAGTAVMAQAVRLHASAPARGPVARLFGRDPLGADVRPWYTGALGEREVGALLRRLPEAWTVFHAVPVGSGDADVDHVAVGPGGVFVVNTKRHPGARVWVAERSVMVAGQKKPYLRTSDLEASRVRGLLARAGIEAPVQPVVALSGVTQLTVRQPPRRAAVVRAEDLVRWLTRRPAVLHATTVEAVVALLDDPATWRAVSATPAAAALPLAETVTRFDAIEREVRSARFVRAGWALAGMLAIAAAGASAGPVVTGVMNALAG